MFFIIVFTHNYKHSLTLRITTPPTTPIRLKKEKPGPSNPTGHTSAY